MQTKLSKGFTLIEILVALIIFSFMIASMATMYSTVTNNAFQNYRVNIVKSNASIAMKTMTSTLQTATRVDLPTWGVPDWCSAGPGTCLAFASNVDQLTGCYPINPAQPVYWHFFCRPPGNLKLLYYHTNVPNTVAGGGICPNGPFLTPVSYPIWACGPGGSGGTITLINSNLDPNTVMFSRLSPELVRINMRIVWDPALEAVAGRNFTTTAKRIDETLAATILVKRQGAP